MILNCVGVLGTCCNDGGIVLLVDTSRKVLNIIQIVVPIILIIWATIGFIQLVMNPEEKNGLRKILNKFTATIIVFLLPAIVNFVLGLMPETFTLGACWKQSENKAEMARQNSKYINPYAEEKRTSILSKPDDYAPGKKKATPSADTSWDGGTVTGEQVVAYAKSFIGGKYCKGGKDLNKCVDCVGFVRAVYQHFGLDVDNNDDKLFHSGKYTDVTNAPHRPGDVVMYEGHWAMMTGNGNEIVHAMSPKLGIRTSKDYRKSSKPIWKIFRVNAVK
ncbi:MAG: C40 family peptidase [Bacilli bacterium]|nr:C40 family peptidase [Bacilli bacterium]